MPMTRLPRIFLSSWVNNKCPQLRPQFNYGHGLGRDLCNAGVHIDNNGPLLRVAATYGSPSLNERMFTATTTAVAISGLIQNSENILDNSSITSLLRWSPAWFTTSAGCTRCCSPCNPLIPLACKVQLHNTPAAPTDHCNTLIPFTFFITVCSPKSCITATQSPATRRLANPSQAELAGGCKVY
jgi:hypothetical protein